jgi:hypothetical protein
MRRGCRNFQFGCERIRRRLENTDLKRSSNAKGMLIAKSEVSIVIELTAMLHDALH